MIRFLHRSVAVASEHDLPVGRMKEGLIKFLHNLETTLDLQQHRITFRNECLWAADDPAMSKSGKKFIKGGTDKDGIYHNARG